MGTTKERRSYGKRQVGAGQGRQMRANTRDLGDLGRAEEPVGLPVSLHAPQRAPKTRSTPFEHLQGKNKPNSFSADRAALPQWQAQYGPADGPPRLDPVLGRPAKSKKPRGIGLLELLQHLPQRELQPDRPMQDRGFGFESTPESAASREAESRLGHPLGIAAVASLIGCSPWTVRQTLIPQGLPVFRSAASGKLIFYTNQVVRWIERRQQKGGN